MRIRSIRPAILTVRCSFIVTMRPTCSKCRARSLLSVADVIRSRASSWSASHAASSISVNAVTVSEDSLAKSRRLAALFRRLDVISLTHSRNRTAFSSLLRLSARRSPTLVSQRATGMPSTTPATVAVKFGMKASQKLDEATTCSDRHMANSITVNSSSHVTACAFSSPAAGRTERQLQAQPAPGSLVPRPFEASQLDLPASFRLVTAVQLPAAGSDLNPGTSSLSGIFPGCVQAARAQGGQLLGTSGVSEGDRGCPLDTGLVLGYGTRMAGAEGFC